MEYSVGFTKYFDEADILLASEFWDYLSGVHNTMETIIEIINAIATPNFMKELTFLNEPQNRIKQKQDYLNLLERWFLFQEYELVNNDKNIVPKLTTKKLQNLYSQSCFKDGDYKWQRVLKLLSL
jgi:hypothetical protein